MSGLRTAVVIPGIQAALHPNGKRCNILAQLGVFLLLVGLARPALTGRLSDAVTLRFRGDEANKVSNQSQVIGVLQDLVNKSGAQAGGPLQPFVDWAARFAHEPDGATSAKVAELDAMLDNSTFKASLPAIRRTIVAGVVLRYLADGSLDAVTELALHGILMRLYAEHCGTAARKGVAEFTHLSKAGGSSLCHLSQMNSCKPPHNNCVLGTWGDLPRWTNANYILGALPRGVNITSRIFWPYRRRVTEYSCSERRERLLSHRQYFYAHEYTNMGGTEDPAKAHTCHNEMVTVLLAREPEKRTLSHIRHWWRFFNMDVQGEERKLFFPKGYNDEDTWRNIMAASLDNGLTRALLGEALFHSPFGSVTREHLDLARSLVLQQYDVVLVRDDPEQYDTAIRLGLGWCTVPVHDMHQVYKDDVFNFRPEAIWAAVRDTNMYDRQLYTYTIALSQLDLVVYDIARAAGYGQQNRLVRELLNRGFEQLSHLGVHAHDLSEARSSGDVLGGQAGHREGASGLVRGEADLKMELDLCSCGLMAQG